MRTYTHPDVLTRGIAEGWADPETDPTRIDWPQRQAAAAIPFNVVGGRPVNPCERTGIRYGRNELGHWGEARAADALVYAVDGAGIRWVLMIERGDGYGWALPGGMVDPGETPAAAARELAEETGLRTGRPWQTMRPRYVPDPRASDESWIVTTVCAVYLGTVNGVPAKVFPVDGADDARSAAWVRANTFDHLRSETGGQLFPAHVEILRDVL